MPLNLTTNIWSTKNLHLIQKEGSKTFTSLIGSCITCDPWIAREGLELKGCPAVGTEGVAQDGKLKHLNLILIVLIMISILKYIWYKNMTLILVSLNMLRMHKINKSFLINKIRFVNALDLIKYQSNSRDWCLRGQFKPGKC